MEYQYYKDCSDAQSLNNGDIKGFYDFSSGEGEFIYNQLHLHPNHKNASGIVIDILPGLLLGDSNLVPSFGGYLSGTDVIKIGNHVPFAKEWSAVLDISPELCSYANEDNLSRILFSSMRSLSSESGFHVGINQSNRLYVQYNTGTLNVAHPFVNHANNSVAYTRTLAPEINKNCIVTISQSEKDISIGAFDLNTEELTTQSIPVREEFQNSNTFYFGHFPVLDAGFWGIAARQEYTGYQGYINSIALYSGMTDRTEADLRCNCMFSTGIEVTSSVTETKSSNITGYEEFPSYATGVTGFIEYSTNLVDDDGTNLAVYGLQGVTGQFVDGLDTFYLTGEQITTSVTSYTSGVSYDDDKKSLYNRYFLNFRGGLTKGEIIEFFSFDTSRSDNQLKPDLLDEQKVLSEKIKLYYYGVFNQSDEDASLSSIEGHQYDYFIDENMQLSGYAIDQHNLIYDIVDDRSVCTDWSGVWRRSKVDVATGASQPADWWPRPVSHPWWTQSGQFIQTGSGTLNTGEYDVITITGLEIFAGSLSGQVIKAQQLIEDTEFYINGIKLTEDVNYTTGIFNWRDASSHVNIPDEWDLTHKGGANDKYYDGEIVSYNDGGGLEVYVCNSTAGTLLDPTTSYWDSWVGEPAININASSLPDFYYTGLTLDTGQGDTTYQVGGVDTPEICFVPKLSGEEPNRILKITTGNLLGMPDPASGYSEMLWINGMRQERHTDYRKGLECSLNNSFTFFEENPLMFYNNDENYLNFE